MKKKILVIALVLFTLGVSFVSSQAWLRQPPPGITIDVIGGQSLIIRNSSDEARSLDLLIVFDNDTTTSRYITVDPTTGYPMRISNIKPNPYYSYWRIVEVRILGWS